METNSSKNTRPGKLRDDGKKQFIAQNEIDYKAAGSPGLDVDARTAPHFTSGNFADSAQYSDEQIEASVREALTNESAIDASDFAIFVKEGIVTLKGTIETIEKKRIAEEAILEIPGVDHVHNELRLGSPEFEGFGEQARSDLSGNPVLRGGKENPVTHGDENGPIH